MYHISPLSSTHFYNNLIFSLKLLVKRKAQAPWSSTYKLLEKANAFPSCDANAADAFLVEGLRLEIKETQ
jgi:hypothetical protein